MGPQLKRLTATSSRSACAKLDLVVGSIGMRRSSRQRDEYARTITHLPRRTAAPYGAHLEVGMPEKLEAFVARRIRELRMERGLSIRQLALRSGLPPEMISRSERAVSSPSMSTLDHVFSGLGVDPSEFFAHPTAFRGASAAASQRRFEALLDGLKAGEQDEVLRGLGLLLGVRRRSPRPRRRSKKQAV